MPITELNHYFVRANDLEKSKRFYIEVLGMEVMPRPDLPFPGYWLGANGKVQVHMGPHGIPNAQLYYLGSPPNAATGNSGVVDHIAFLASEPGTFSQRFNAMGIGFKPRFLREFQLYQLLLADPDGLTIELNFFGIQDDPNWGGEDYAQMPRVEAVS